MDQVAKDPLCLDQRRLFLGSNAIVALHPMAFAILVGYMRWLEYLGGGLLGNCFLLSCRSIAFLVISCHFLARRHAVPFSTSPAHAIS